MLFGLTGSILWAIDIATIIAAVFAFIDCLRRREDAFPAIGRHSKGLWLALTGGSALVGMARFNPIGWLGLAAIVICAVYLLDIRPRIIEITGGR
ncbi:MAG: DUF2516 family protein [Candidatus Nanopelagicales bacterium]